MDGNSFLGQPLPLPFFFKRSTSWMCMSVCHPAFHPLGLSESKKTPSFCRHPFSSFEFKQKDERMDGNQSSPSILFILWVQTKGWKDGWQPVTVVLPSNWGNTWLSSNVYHPSFHPLGLPDSKQITFILLNFKTSFSKSKVYRNFKSKKKGLFPSILSSFQFKQKDERMDGNQSQWFSFSTEMALD